jgi:hypothetical protein
MPRTSRARFLGPQQRLTGGKYLRISHRVGLSRHATTIAAVDTNVAFVVLNLPSLIIGIGMANPMRA